MDPQQRTLLHVAHEALENAGYVPDSSQSWKREDFGCYIGAATGDWTDCLREHVDLYHSTGNSWFLWSCGGSDKLHLRYPPGIFERAGISFHEMGRTVRCRGHSLLIFYRGNPPGMPRPAEW